MSDPRIDIRRAFEIRLGGMPSLPAVAWENTTFPPAGTPTPSTYLKPFLVTGKPSQVEIGTDAQNRYPGFYQISIYVKAGTGNAALDTLQSAIYDRFKRGTVLTNGVLTFKVISAPEVAPPIQETDWWHVPITIYFRCDASN